MYNRWNLFLFIPTALFLTAHYASFFKSPRRIGNSRTILTFPIFLSVIACVLVPISDLWYTGETTMWYSTGIRSFDLLPPFLAYGTTAASVGMRAR